MNESNSNQIDPNTLEAIGKLPHTYARSLQQAIAVTLLRWPGHVLHINREMFNEDGRPPEFSICVINPISGTTSIYLRAVPNFVGDEYYSLHS